MSTNIRIQRICQHCGNEFTAQTTVTKYCGDTCAKRAYKARKRADKIEASNTETQRIKTQPIEEIRAKVFLTVRDVATLINCSIRTAYRLIERGNIKAVNIAQRKTLVQRSEIDKLFEQPQPVKPLINGQPQQFDKSECYNLAEIQLKYDISEKTIYNLIKRNNIPKFRKGKFAYVPKVVIDQLLS